MDFQVVGFEGLVGSDTPSSGFVSSSLASSDPESKHNKWYGSGLFKHERSSGNIINEDDWCSSKLAKTDHDFSAASKTATLLQQHRNNTLLRSTATLFSDGQQHLQNMLSFSSAPKSDATLPYFHLTSPDYSRSTGLSINGSYNGASMHGVFTGARGPFTPSQWMELEHQALIYKYITANVPIPSNLLIPIRKALDSAGFSSLTGGLPRPINVGWGTFHLGFSHNNDPEPGRCRRTDGKKWRCSRDAVADQKYCERHMNRGRHRSRKPVEGHSGHSAAATSKPMTTTTTASTSASTVGASIGGSGSGSGSGGGTSNSLAIAHQQLNTFQTGGVASNHSAATPIGRMFLNKEIGSHRLQDASTRSVLSPSTDLKSKENSFVVSKQQFPFEESMRTEFGVVSSNSLLNPSNKSFSLMDCRNYGSCHDLTEQETESQHPLRQFMDDWPKNPSDRSAISWPEVDRTQLSISIPRVASDFMSSTSCPNNDKVTLSPLKLSREFDPIQMGLGVGSVINEPNQRQANWIPVTWETSMGGPLGEVLHSTSNSAAESRNSSALNLMTEGWENSPRLGSSPTGVLQKTTFGSLSNSSAGSSPRAENNKTHEGVASAMTLAQL